MCGIVGITGTREVAPVILDALKRLEYRGYDSSGIATLVNGEIERRRSPGKLGALGDVIQVAEGDGAMGAALIEAGPAAARNDIGYKFARMQMLRRADDTNAAAEIAMSIPRLLPYPAASHPSGEILFQGRDLLKVSEAELRAVRGNDVTMIFQDPLTSLNPLYRVGDQLVETIREHLGLDAAAARRRAVSGMSSKRSSCAKRARVSAISAMAGFLSAAAIMP